MSYALQFVEIDIDFCENVYGNYPCEAAIGVTGEIKCFNSLGTCQDRLNFINDPVTLRFSFASNHYPRSIEAIPNVTGISFTPPVVSLGKDLGERATLTVTFKDHRHSDTGPGFDPYRTERGYDPFKRGTFWGKFRARQPFLRGRKLRVIRGFLGQTLEQMETRHYIIESFDGPKPDGTYKIMAKDAVKLADDDRSIAPFVSPGRLAAALLSSVAAGGSFTVAPNDSGLQYLVEGYVAIGGKEVIQYSRNEELVPGTSLMLNFETPVASIAVVTGDLVDESPNDHLVTVAGAGNYNTGSSTTPVKFGQYGRSTTGSAYLTLPAGTTFELGTGDFTIDFWYSDNGAGAQKTLIDFRPSAGNGLYPRLYHTSGRLLRYHQNSADRITGTTALQASSAGWDYIELSRVAGVTRLFLNGVQEGSDYADTNNYIVGAASPVIGSNGNSRGTELSATSRFDAIRVIKGTGLHTANYTPPTRPTGDPDVFSIVARAQMGTEAIDHDDEDRVQQVLQYETENPAAIIHDLLTNYANMDPAYIDLETWESEVNTYLQRNYSANIAEPTGVHSLINEIIEQSGLAIWWDDLAQKLRLRVIREVPITAPVIGEGQTIEGSLNITEQPNKRVSQVNTFYGLRNVCESHEDADNYRSVAVNIDPDTETDYGSPAIKNIFSRWIPPFGLSIAERANEIYIARYRDPPRRFDLRLQKALQDIELGGSYFIESFILQDETGDKVPVPVQVTRLDPTSESYGITAEEVLFSGLELDDTGIHTVSIDFNTNSFNLKEIHDSLYGEITDPTGFLVRCIVEEGFVVGSDDVSTAALDVGAGWVPGLAIEIIVRTGARIQGKGGKGGYFNTGGSVTQAPEVGGTALKTTVPIDLILESGSEVFGGGGGGGGGFRVAGSARHCPGGGGGAGTEPGEGAEANSINFGSTGYASHGSDGDGDEGGAGYNAFGVVIAGDGGDPGQAGGTATGGTSNQTGGAAGNAIDGVSLCSITDSGADRQGPEIN